MLRVDYGRFGCDYFNRFNQAGTGGDVAADQTPKAVRNRRDGDRLNCVDRAGNLWRAAFEVDARVTEVRAQQPDRFVGAFATIREGFSERLELRFLPADANAIPFEDDRFDVVISWGSLEHIAGGHAQALREIRRVLKPDGLLFAHPVNRTSRNGVTGMPSRATAAAGERLFAMLVEDLTAQVSAGLRERPPLAASYFGSFEEEAAP